MIRVTKQEISELRMSKPLPMFNGIYIKKPVSPIFVELGYIAKTDFIKDLVKVNQAGEIIVVDKNQATSEPRIFAVGNITDTPFKQAITSAGDGAKA